MLSMAVLSLNSGHRTHLKSLFTKLVSKLKAAFALPEAEMGLAFA